MADGETARPGGGVGIRLAGDDAPGMGNRGRRRRSRGRAAVLVLLLTVVAVSGVVLVAGAADRPAGRRAPPPSAAAPVADREAGAAEDAEDAEDGDDRQTAGVLVSHDPTAPAASARITVLAYDRDRDRGVVVLVPGATSVQVPGYGDLELGEAFALGRTPLVDAALANLLGIRFEVAASLTQGGWAATIERIGGFEVDVPSSLRAPSGAAGQVRFEAGPQFLDGPRLAEYLLLQEPDETELESLPRVQDVLEGTLDALAQDPSAVDAIFADGAPMIETPDPHPMRRLLDDLVDARARDRLTTVTLPVVPLASGRQERYGPDVDRVDALVDEHLAAFRPSSEVAAGRAVQILNGNGTPAIGQRVAERLAGGGYRVVLTGNADRFDHDTTRIVVYDDTDAQLTVARDVRDRLGVGEIRRSTTTQSVVDLTIVVGADFVG